MARRGGGGGDEIPARTDDSSRAVADSVDNVQVRGRSA